MDFRKGLVATRESAFHVCLGGIVTMFGYELDLKENVGMRTAQRRVPS